MKNGPTLAGPARSVLLSLTMKYALSISVQGNEELFQAEAPSVYAKLISTKNGGVHRRFYLKCSRQLSDL